PGAGSGTVTPSLGGDTLANYSITSNSGSWSITQASSTVSVTCPGSVTYNGTAQTPCTAGVTGAGGLNQSLTVNYSNNTSAGSATASATFAGDTNHAGSNNSGGFTINPAPVTATAGSYSGVYDGSTHALSACQVAGVYTGSLTCTNNPTGPQVAGVYTGSLTCTNNPTGPVGPGAGSGTVTPSLGGDTLANYSITSNSGSWSITQTSQTISFTTNAPSNEVYNGQFTVAATATSGLAVTFTSSGACSNSGATYTMTSGTGTCLVMANQAGNTNYAAATQVTQTVNATLASQAINFTQPSSPVTYGASVSLVAAGGFSGNPVTFSVISGPGSVSGANGATLSFTGVGTVVVAANQAGSSNYAAATQVTRSITVNQAVLTVTANNASMNVGGAVPTLTASYSGFVNGDTSAVLGGSPTLTTTATSSSPAGNYPITVALGTLTAANYTFTFVNGTLSVVTPPTTSDTVSTTLTGSAAAGYVLTITVQNTGASAISNAVLTAATLGSTSGSPLPQTWGTIAAGSAAVFTVNFPGSVGADGAGVAERYSGTYTGGSFVGSFRSVTLP
ncbi:MAG: MBG domain-containing protein, partial [Terracidiphilus sp.]